VAQFTGLLDLGLLLGDSHSSGDRIVNFIATDSEQIERDQRPTLAPSLGAVSYLNSKPLIWCLEQFLPAARRSLDLPSRLADQLTEGHLDVALVPIVEHLRQPETQLLSTACIACDGPVWSVKVYFRVPPPDVRTLALDEGSRTSAALCQILLHSQTSLSPTLKPLPIGSSVGDIEADAVLMIGDRAMHTPAGEYCEVWDLGQQWHRHTGLPFVFAAWVARPEIACTEELARALDLARNAGIARISEIARIEAPKVGLTPDQVTHYLSHHLRFTMGQREQKSIERFAHECRKLGLLEATS
jgi:chorismate dehydratase